MQEKQEAEKAAAQPSCIPGYFDPTSLSVCVPSAGHTGSVSCLVVSHDMGQTDRRTDVDECLRSVQRSYRHLRTRPRRRRPRVSRLWRYIDVYSRCSKEGAVRHRQSKEASILWSHHEGTGELPGERDDARNNARCTKARKAMHGLDGQHQDVDWTLRGRVNQNERGQR